MIPETHSLVLTTDYRVPDPTRVWPLLQRRRDGLAALGAHHVFVYTSTTDPERVLVTIALETREPVAELLRSRAFFEWFDAVGVEDLPAVFAGELIEGSISSPIRLQRRPASSSWASWSSTTLPCSGPVCARRETCS
jgi:hypothetical protein